MHVRPARLLNPVRAYPWGSTQVIAQLQGRPSPSSGPEAELWLGAHPTAPSIAVHGAQQMALDAAITADPIAWLGRDIVERFGPRLPFLMKVLAAERPLSLQAHPAVSQARSGFAAEEARGIPVDAPHRHYRDQWPKPELLRAVTPFTALCGFRDVRRSRELFDALAVPSLSWLPDDLGDDERGDDETSLLAAVRRLLTLPAVDRTPMVAAVAAACARLADAGDEWAKEAAWGRRLAVRHPGDPGVVVALLLELIELRPGDALYVPPGNLHAYLHGVAVEIMASSDNVLRGGLTLKHVDPGELLEVVAAGAAPTARIEVVICGDERVYPLTEPHFRLSEIVLVPGAVARLDERGAQLLLSTNGSVTVATEHGTVELRSGEGAVVPAVAGIATLTGTGTVFRATVGQAVASHTASG